MPSRGANRAKPAPRAWQRMLSGRRLDLLDPSPIDIEIEDIAHGLARVARWNGQTAGPRAFSVAQHSVLVEEFCRVLRPDWRPAYQMAALLHDAPEFVIGDMISPFKSAIGDNYKSIENRLQKAIHIRFGVPAELPSTIEKVIKRADRASAFFEATQFAGFTDAEARSLFGSPRGIAPMMIEVETTNVAQTRFLARFNDILAAT